MKEQKGCPCPILRYLKAVPHVRHMRLVPWKALLGLGSGYREGTLVQLLTLEAAKWKEYAASCLCVGIEDSHFWRLDLIPIIGLH